MTTKEIVEEFCLLDFDFLGSSNVLKYNVTPTVLVFCPSGLVPRLREKVYQNPDKMLIYFAEFLRIIFSYRINGKYLRYTTSENFSSLKIKL